MERELESLLLWWDVSGVGVPEIKPAAKKRSKVSAHRPVSAKESISTKPKTTPQITVSAPHNSNDISDLILAARKVAASAKTVAELQKAITNFDVGALSDAARQPVFSRGNPEASVMVISEAPGTDEDRQGKPFVGPSGQLLDKIFASIGLDETSLYITNIINWHRPGNRNPSAQDIEICRPLIERHIELIAPKVVILVGSVSMNTLSDRKGITKSRGEWTEIKAGKHECPGLIVYHPAYLLRQPQLKKETWRDMLALKQHLAEPN